MKIAFIGAKGLPAKGGGERVVEALIKRLILHNEEVTLYGKKEYCEPNDLINKINIIYISTFKGKHLNPFIFGLCSAFHALFFGKYDLIHLHYADFGYLAPLLRLKYKIIGTSHGAEYNRDKWNFFAKLFFKFSEILFVYFCNTCTSVSLSLKKYYEKKYKKTVHYIPNGVSCNNITSNKLKENGDYILFIAGRIIPTKGLHILLKANRIMKTNLPILIAGEIEDKNYNLELLDLTEKNVNYLGFISDVSELNKLIANCKLFVFPSQYEAMSMALLEVAIQGKMIICSDIDQNYDAIEDNAIYFKVDDYKDLAKKIDNACSDSSVKTDYSKNTIDWIRKNRNWDLIIKKYQIEYSSLIN